MNVSSLQGRALQVAVLETFLKMRDKVPALRRYTHIRAERSRMTVHWTLLQADEHTVHEQKRTNFGDAANTAMWRIFEPFVTGQTYEVARITMAFYPHPTMSIDVLDEHNTPIISMKLVTIEVADGPGKTAH